MNHIEKTWIETAKAVKGIKGKITTLKNQQLQNRITKKGIERSLRKRKALMNSAMRAGHYAEVSLNHRTINVLREMLANTVVDIEEMKARIRKKVALLAEMEEKRDEFERAYYLIEQADREIMHDNPIIPMHDEGMEEIVKELGL